MVCNVLRFLESSLLFLMNSFVPALTVCLLCKSKRKDEAHGRQKRTSARKSTQRSICVCGRSRNDLAGHSVNS